MSTLLFPPGSETGLHGSICLLPPLKCIANASPAYFRKDNLMATTADSSTLPMPRQSVLYHWLISHNFCGWADPLVAKVKTPLGALIIAFFVVLMLGIAVGTGMFWAAGTIFFIGIVGTIWPALTIRGLRGNLEFNRRRTREYEPVQTALTLENHWPWPTWGVTCRQDLSEGDAAACGGIPGGGKATFTTSFTPRKRGLYPSSKPALSTGFPFGIYSHSRPTTVTNRLIVWPRTVTLRSLIDSAETRPSEDRFTDARCGESGDVLGTRPFRNGDSLRRIHWPQTARTGTLVVCERQAPATSAIRIVFDTDPSSHESFGGENSLEWVIRIAASIAAAYHEKQASVECCFGDQVIQIASGGNGLTSFFDHLASYESRVASLSQTTTNGSSMKRPTRQKPRVDRGVFQVRITTCLGLLNTPEHQSVQGDQLCIVLSKEPVKDSESIGHTKTGRILWIRSTDDPLREFKQSWERLCHVG